VSLAERVPRFDHGSRVPGWDEAVDLTKDPATVPDLANTPVPAELKDTILAAMAKYPDRRSAAIPALHAAEESARNLRRGGSGAGSGPTA